MELRIIRRSIAGFACAAALAAAAGCGGGDEQSAGDAAQAYADATNQGDSARICELYSDQLKQSLAIETNCEGFVEEQSSGGPPGEMQVVDVSDDDDQATANLDTIGESGQPVRIRIALERQDGDWRITSLNSVGN